MNIQEFTKLAGFQPKESYYHTVIEVEYMYSEIQDKAEWVKQWKKQGGIQRAYDDMVRVAGNIEEARDYYQNKIKNLNEKIDNLHQVVEAANAEARDYREKFEDVKEKLFNRKVEFNEVNDELNRKLLQEKEMAYFLIEQSEKYSSAELRAKVIDMIGFKAYIDYKFEHNMCIWQLDRDEIMKKL